MISWDEHFSKRLTELRNQKGASARDMSLSIGQNANYINRIENKKAFPSMMGFFYICDYFGITPEEFFQSDNKHPEQLNALIENIKKLDEHQLALITGIVEEFVKSSKKSP